MKVILYTLLVSIVVGSLFLGTVFFLKLQPVNKQTTLISTQPVTSQPTGLTFSLSSPEDNHLVFKNDLLVQGKTASDAAVLISIGSSDLVIHPENDGTFSKTIKLEEGENFLTVLSFNNNGENKVEKRFIYYSKEEL